MNVAPRIALLLAATAAALLTPTHTRAGAAAAVWATSQDLSRHLTPLPDIPFTPKPADDGPVVRILEPAPHQRVLGMGASLEGSTCSNLWRMSREGRERVLRQLLDPEQGIGMSLMRVCIGTSDFTGDPWYSYDDLPPGETDPGLTRFSIARDRDYLIPVIREARRIRPNLLFFASAWSPPGWMKTTGSLIGGEVQPRWYDAYARYLVRFIQAYEREGIPIHAITVQNEPGVDRAKEKDPRWFYPSCHWSGEQERDFIRDHLGPALRRAGLKTRIWCFDHNYTPEPGGDDNGLRHPRTILADRAAARYVDGVAFHGYTGNPQWMARFHDEFPDKPVYFTEGSAFSVYGAVDIIERLRNGACSYNAWVILLDEKGQPNNGPFPASHAAIRLDSPTLREEYLFEFYNYGQFMRFIRPGAVRLTTGEERAVAPHVVFRNPDGTFVLVSANTESHPASFTICHRSQWASVSIPAKTVVTLRWK